MNTVIQPENMDEMKKHYLKIKMQSRMQQLKHSRMSSNGKQNFEAKLEAKKKEQQEQEDIEEERKEILKTKKADKRRRQKERKKLNTIQPENEEQPSNPKNEDLEESNSRLVEIEDYISDKE